MKFAGTLLGLASMLLLVSCGGGGGGSTGGTTSGNGSGSGSQTLLTVSLSGDYFAVPASDPDFNASGAGGVTTGLVQPTLGPDGLPVITSKAQQPGTTINDVNAVGEIQWWSAPRAGVVQDFAAKVDPLPFSFDNFFPAGQTSDSLTMRTVHWKGTITTTAAGTLIFDGAADDDLWVFVDSKLVVDNGGVKNFQAPVDVPLAVAAGTHSIDVFYADRSMAKATIALAIRLQ
jgi:fibro-slime domain-containing protein